MSSAAALLYLLADVLVNFAFFGVLHAALAYTFALFLRHGPQSALDSASTGAAGLWLALTLATPALLEVAWVRRQLTRGWALWLPWPPVLLFMLTRVDDALARSVLAILALPFVAAQLAGRLARPATEAAAARTYDALALALLAHTTIRLGSFSLSPSLYQQILFGVLALVGAAILAWEDMPLSSPPSPTTTPCPPSRRAILATVPLAWSGAFLLLLVLHLVVSPHVLPRYAGVAPQPLAALLVLAALAAGVWLPLALPAAATRGARALLGGVAAAAMVLGTILLLTLNLFGGLLFAFSVGPALHVWLREMRAQAALGALGRVALLGGATFACWLPLYATNWFADLRGSPKELFRIAVPNRIPYWETFIIPAVVAAASTLLLSLWPSAAADDAPERPERRAAFRGAFAALALALFVPSIAVNAAFARVVERPLAPAAIRVASMSATLGLDAAGYQNLAELGARVDADAIDLVAVQAANALSFGTGSHDVAAYLGALAWHMHAADSSAAEGLAPTHGVALFARQPLADVRFAAEPCRTRDLYRQPCTGRAFASARLLAGDTPLRLVTAGPRLDALALAWLLQHLGNDTAALPTIACFDFDAAVDANATLAALGLRAATPAIWHSAAAFELLAAAPANATLRLIGAQPRAPDRLADLVADRQRNGLIILLVGMFIPVAIGLIVSHENA